MNLTTKFRPSIISYASVLDIEMIIDELLEDINEKIAECEEEKKQFPTQSNELNCEIYGYLSIKNLLLDKQLETAERYRP